MKRASLGTPIAEARVRRTAIARLHGIFMALHTHRRANVGLARTARCLIGAALLAAGTAHGQGSDELTALVNAYRDAPQRCEGMRMPPAGVLAPSEALTRVRVPPGTGLSQGLDDAGYQAATSRLIWVSGLARADAVMAMLAQSHCRTILDPRYTDIGVSRSGKRWRIVLAQPLLAPDLGDWQAAGRRTLELVNAARTQPRSCGDKSFAAAPPLAWNEQLAAAARAHSSDMARRSELGHAGSDGSTSAQRATRQGYAWRAVGENVAGGQGSAEKVVAGWLASPTHCANIMSPDFTEMGAAYATNPESGMRIYWTQVFGRPQ